MAPSVLERLRRLTAAYERHREQQSKAALGCQSESVVAAAARPPSPPPLLPADAGGGNKPLLLAGGGGGGKTTTLSLVASSSSSKVISLSASSGASTAAPPSWLLDANDYCSSKEAHPRALPSRPGRPLDELPLGPRVVSMVTPHPHPRQ